MAESVVVVHDTSPKHHSDICCRSYRAQAGTVGLLSHRMGPVAVGHVVPVILTKQSHCSASVFHLRPPAARDILRLASVGSESIAVTIQYLPQRIVDRTSSHSRTGSSLPLSSWVAANRFSGTGPSPAPHLPKKPSRYSCTGFLSESPVFDPIGQQRPRR